MEFKIEKPQHFCAACKKMFGDGEAKIATLNLADEEGAFVRRDFCIDCWSRQNPEDFRCTWVTSHSERRRPALLDADLLWQVLHAAAPQPTDENNTQTSPRTASSEKGDPEFAYVAALGLLRLKQLSMEDVRREQTVNWYLFRGRGASAKVEFYLRDPGLNEAGITLIQDRLAEFAERRTRVLTTDGAPRGVSKATPNMDGADTMIMVAPSVSRADIEAAIELQHDSSSDVSRSSGKKTLKQPKAISSAKPTGKTTAVAPKSGKAKGSGKTASSPKTTTSKTTKKKK